MMSEVYYEVHMSRVLHTAKIIIVDSVMFVNKYRSAESEGLRFVSSWVSYELRCIFLFLFTNMTLSTLLILAVCRTRVI